jgi:uracil-DNA glycosylase
VTLEQLRAEIRARAGCGFEICEAATHLVPGEGSALFPLYHPAAALHAQKLRETPVADARALGRALAA